MLALLLSLELCCLSAGITAQHRERQRADKGGPADQDTSLHQEQHPWHMARDNGKRANTQRDAPQKDKRERVHGKVPTKY
eukprot:483638-Pelagomonas_calceolata.AAC.1